MAKVFIEETTLTAIGDAIREKEGTSDLIPVADMSSRISAIPSGSGGGIPQEALLLTGDCSRMFTNKWDWFVTSYGNQVTTKNITDIGYMFNGTQLEEIPFQLNISGCYKIDNTFAGTKLKVSPKIRGTIQWSTSTTIQDVVTGSYYLKDVEDLFTTEMLDGYSTVKVTGSYSAPKPYVPENMYSQRSLPSWFFKQKLNPESTSYPSTSYCLYNYLCYMCSSMDEITGIPVWTCAGAQTSSMFSSAFYQATRLKNVTFETNEDGTPIVTSWKNQTIDLSKGVGHIDGSYYGYITTFNSGITNDKQVNDDATYQALKDDPDWFAVSNLYSRYNHDSAVATINSLPDTSAYLASAGGTNTIKFVGTAGSSTDGGAINTLTEEEIAVATAKGWTVTLV